MRAQLRHGVAELLQGLTTTGDRVFPSRVHRLARTDLPALLVYTRSETARVGTMGTPRDLSRSVTLVVEAVARGDEDDLDDTLDAIAVEVEAKIATTAELGGVAADAVYGGMEIEVDDAGSHPVAAMTMTWAVLVTTAEDDPESAI